ncbi:MAG: hypothetical protein HZC28_03200 [Spirochaetes bacterium]|nr:hypothetical protein [Spirochaetota bacterium]
MSELRSYSTLRARIDAYRFRRRNRHIARSLFVASGALAAAVPLLLVYDRLMGVSIWHLYVLIGAAAAACVAGAVYCIHGFRKQVLSFTAAVTALDAEQDFGFLLQTYFEFVSLPERSETQTYFLENADRRLADMTLKTPSGSSAVYRFAAIAGGAALVSVLVFIPWNMHSIMRYARALPWYAAPALAVSVEHPRAVQRYSAATISVHAADAERVEISHNKKTYALPAAGNVWGYSASNIEADYKFRVVAYNGKNVVRLPERVIAVTDPSFFRAIHVTVKPPSHTRSPALTYNNGNAEVLSGSGVIISGEANNRITEALVSVYRGSTTNNIQAQVRGSSVNAFFTVTNDMEYRFTLVDEYGFTNEATPVYRISVLRDERPSVEVISPRGDITMERPRPLRISYRADDDYGIRRLMLTAKVFDANKSAVHRTNEFLIAEGNDKTLAGVYEFDCRLLNPHPGYRIIWRLEAMDGASQTGVTEEYTISIPSMAEMFLAMNKKQEQTAAALSDMSEQGKSLTEGTKALARDAQRKEALGDKVKQESRERAVESMKHETEMMQKKLSSLTEEMSRTIREAEVNKLMSTEVIEKLKEVREALKGLQKETLAALQKNFESMMREVPGNEKSKNAQAAAMNAETFAKKIDNLLAMLKSLKDLERVSFLAKEMRDIAVREQALAASMREAPPTASQMQEQAVLEQRLKDVVNGVLENTFGLSPEKKDAVADILKKEAVASLANRMSQTMKENRKSAMNDMARSLDRAATELESMLASMSMERPQAAVAVIDETLFNLHVMAIRYAALLERLSAETAQFRFGKGTKDAVAVAKELAHFQTVVRALRDKMRETLSGQVIGIDALIARFDAVVNAIDTFSSSVDNRFAPMVLPQTAGTIMNENNRLIYTLLKLKNDFNNEGQQSSGQGMSSMSERQKSINSRTQSMFGSSGKERSMEGLGDYLSELAAEQEMIQQAMQKLADGAKEQKRGGGSGGEGDGTRKAGKDGLGDLDAMADQMAKIKEELKALAENYNEKKHEALIQRQQKLLDRMLTYEKGLKKSNEESREREAQQATNDLRAGAGDDISELERIRRVKMIEEALLSKKYPAEYRKEIEAYLEYLKRTR